MTPDYLAGFEAGARAMRESAVEVLRLHVHCHCRTGDSRDSRTIGQEHWGDCLLRLHNEIRALPTSPPESIASTPEAAKGLKIRRCPSCRVVLNSPQPHETWCGAVPPDLAAHTQPEEKPGMPTATASLTCPWCGKALKVATFGPCFECLAKAERPERQEPPKHRKVVRASTTDPRGYDERCEADDRIWPCPQAPAPAEKEKS